MKFMKKIMAAVAASAVVAVSVVGASLSAYALQPATGAPYTVYMAVSAGSEQQWNPGEISRKTVITAAPLHLKRDLLLLSI